VDAGFFLALPQTERCQAPKGVRGFAGLEELRHAESCTMTWTTKQARSYVLKIAQEVANGPLPFFEKSIA
jgi:hypothetical protein